MIGVWFRKCLRLRDNAALLRACEESRDGGSRSGVVCFFILDPWFDRRKVGVNRFQFLLESLRDLDEQLRTQFRSRLLVLRGRPAEVLQDIFEGRGPFRVETLFWEFDSEPYARKRDAAIAVLAKSCGVRTASFQGHTLLDLDKVISSPGFRAPISMRDIQALVTKAGPIEPPAPVPKTMPPLQIDGFDVPDVSEIYSDEEPVEKLRSSELFPGGEREALRRLDAICSDASYVCNFEKPKTASTGVRGKPWEPSTTGLSPYLKFGCISVREVWHALEQVCQGRRHSQPPQSLHGQVLFREMFYVLGAAVPNFDQEEGNSMCKPIPWGRDEALLAAWSEGRTGFPFIDALMRQLRLTGWIHHLGRHAVACFLTRGDLWQSWSRGRDVFDQLLLDADWALNNGNWLWLAGVAPFSAPYFRIYDPCPGGKSSLNAEQTGEFVRHFVPELKDMPAKYIYKPWTAPLAVQHQARCVIGRDYPAPIVDHPIAREANIEKFKAALDDMRGGEGGGDADSLALPQKFGRSQRDPGPMRSTYSNGGGGGGKGVAAGKGTGRFAGKRPEPGYERSGGEGGGRTLQSYFSPAARCAEDSSAAAAHPKQRRWGAAPRRVLLDAVAV